MGFIEIALVQSPSELVGIWNDYINTDDEKIRERFHKQDEKVRFTVLDEKIGDGTRFFVGKEQSVILFSGEKLMDYCIGPGAFLYHSAFENGMYTSKTREWSALIRENSEKFCEASDPSDEITCVVLDMSQGKRLPFTFDEAVYHDISLDMDVVLCGNGYIEVGEADPLITFSKEEYDRKRLLEYTLPDFSEEEEKKLAVDFENAFEKTLIELKENNIDYHRLPYCSHKLIELANRELSKTWIEDKGISVKEIAFSSIYPDEKSVEAMVKIKRERNAASEKTGSAGQEQYQTQWQTQANQQTAQQSLQGQQTTQQSMEAEFIVKSGGCNWIKTPALIQNGKGTLTNKRFIYKKGIWNFIETGIANKIMSGDKNFEFSLTELKAIEIGRQGMQKTIILQLKNGVSYNCFFYEMEEWVKEFNKIIEINKNF